MAMGANAFFLGLPSSDSVAPSFHKLNQGGSRRGRGSGLRKPHGDPCVGSGLSSRITGRQFLSVAEALAKILSGVKIEIVKRPDQAKGFVTLPRRWVPVRGLSV